MSMVINTNLEATRTGNIYNRNNAYMNQALSRVATGQKINSAKDNASLYAISEKMRERMRANDQANQNIQNDTALLKTAQGGIGNTIDILKTLKERALNAANDSNQNSDRGIIAAEVKELVKQINDNAAKVKFNGKSLINGDADTTVAATVASISTANSSSSASTTDPSEYAALETAATKANVDATAASVKGTAYTHDVFRLGDTDILDNFKKINNTNTAAATSTTKLVELLKSDATNAYGDRAFEVGDKITLSFKIDGVEQSNTYTVTSSSLLTSSTAADSLVTGLSGNGVKVQAVTATNQTLKSGDTATADQTIKTYGTNGTDGGAISTVGTNSQASLYVIGDKGKLISDVSLTVTGSVEGVEYNKTYAQTALAANAVYGAYRDPGTTPTTPTTTTPNNAYTFYIGGEQGFNLDVTIGGINMSTLFPSYTEDSFAKLFEDKTTAITAVDAIDKALNTALVEQAQLGAIESRLGYTSDNLITMNENLEAADSAFRDADIAKEMTNYMKYAVLSQASQYMLAQAGQNAYQVLNLLQP